MVSKTNLALPSSGSLTWNVPLNANFGTLNLALGERALGSAEAVRQASAWQQESKGVTYAPPVTTSVWPLTKSLSGLQKR